MMDSAGFNRITQPNLFSQLPTYGAQYKIVRKEQELPRTLYPAPDARYPAYSYAAADGRFVTDYRPHCTQNTPPGAQFTTKAWMQHHADNLIQLSRQRQSEWTGASLPMPNLAPPPAVVISSTPFENHLKPTGERFGLGVARADARAPVLFGTFVIPPTNAELQRNTKKISQTALYEGGRNSLRGSSPQFLQ